MSEAINKPITPVEVIVTYISLGWASILLTNPTIFQQSENFRHIASIVKNEWVIGLICLVLATVKIVGMIIHNIRLRWIGLIMSTVFWVLMSSGFAFAGEQVEFNTGFIVYSGVAVLCLLYSKEVMRVDRAD